MTCLSWALAAVLAAALAGPVRAQSDTANAITRDRSDRGRTAVRIVTTTGDAASDTRAMQQFMGGQFRRYTTVDPETGERISDLLQMVEEVKDGYLLVSNQTDRLRTIVITNRTKLTFTAVDTRDTDRSHWMYGRGPQGNAAGGVVTARLRPGDLLIAQGYLNAVGKFVGTNLRVVGHAYGWYDDADYATSGTRGYGEVRSVDRTRDRIEVQSNLGTLTVSLSRGGEVLYRDRQIGIRDLQRGNRVVFYSYATGRNSLEAFRIVQLSDGQAYPRGNERYWADPRGWNGDNDRGDTGEWMEGNLDYISTGVLLHKLVLNTTRGRSTTFMLSKSLRVIDRDGSRISINALREGELLRVYYTNVDGVLFATRIEAR